MARNRRPLVNARPSADLEAAGLSVCTTTLQSALVCPLLFNERFIGTLSVYHTDAGVLPRRSPPAARSRLRAGRRGHQQLDAVRADAGRLADRSADGPAEHALPVHAPDARAGARRAAEVGGLAAGHGPRQLQGDQRQPRPPRRRPRAVRSRARAARRDPPVRHLRPLRRRRVHRRALGLRRGRGGAASGRSCRRASTTSTSRRGRASGCRSGISIGAAVFPHDGESYESLLATADSRMYQDKAARKRLARHRVDPRPLDAWPCPALRPSSPTWTSSGPPPASCKAVQAKASAARTFGPLRFRVSSTFGQLSLKARRSHARGPAQDPVATASRRRPRASCGSRSATCRSPIAPVKPRCSWRSRHRTHTVLARLLSRRDAQTGWIEFLVKVDGSHPLRRTGERAASRRSRAAERTSRIVRVSRNPTAGALLFIAGGTGIAPLRSMIRHVLDPGPTGPVHLLYSARTSARVRLPAGIAARWPARDAGSAPDADGRQRRDWRHATRPDRRRQLSPLVDPRCARVHLRPPAMLAGVTTALWSWA